MQELYLNYLTINNVLPINKDRLFLCYHKLDKDTALEKGNYLKDLFDCAVFYLDYDLFPNPDIDALKKLVEGMYIFIPIVTKNFLGDSLCLDLFKFAKGKSIPVMPLMIDPSLGSEFNRVCGEIHFLQEKYDIVTYVSLEDKIKDFYNNVVGKKFSYEKQIKEAFKYSIFLSYRRCDREKAYPIIAKLHEDEELYDVGAWYDEFLTYGENFANEIIEKIQNSTIVIIFITNNAFEPGNYVKDEEFNKAKKFGKIIIPVYSEEFDLDEFHKCFPGLMDPISVDEMPNEIKKNIVVTRNADAMHDFFVGVGYLYGMCVPKDAQKAEQIFLKHIDNTNCVRVLAEMYRSGQGVPVDMEKALELKEVLVELEQEENIAYFMEVNICQC